RYVAAGLGAMFVVATGYILVGRRRPVRTWPPRHKPPSRDKSFTAFDRRQYHRPRTMHRPVS
ncbi:MAG: hypothetical protein ACJ8F0_08665, partial [Xanthobacteraceae bacterium]